jgi:pimeloyl-ACP methyl ester carboxylesterase
VTLPPQRLVETNGIRLAVREAGAGPLVLLCHGFPETGRSWRHQIAALAGAGFRAVAPDLRGYGASDAPGPTDAYTILHLVGDVVGLLDALAIEEAVIVGHDWGAALAWHAALMRPDRFRAVVGMSLPFRRRGAKSAIAALREGGHHDSYMLYFQEPGVAEAELERDVAETLRRLYHGGAGEAEAPWRGTVPQGGGFLDATPEPAGELPWLPPDELAAAADAFARSGFRGGLNWYRNLHRNWELMAPFRGAPVRQPALFIAGSRDGTLVLPQMRGRVEALAEAVPGLRRTLILEGAGHWVQQERPQEVNAALIDFLRGL